MPRGALVLLPTVEQLNRESEYGTNLVIPRGGAMWHYDDSSSDASGLGWFKSKDCHLWYTRYYLDNGDVVSISPASERTAHAGLCSTANANSYFYGLAAATNGKIVATEKQRAAMLEDTLRLFHYHAPEWQNVAHRLQGHDEQAIYGPSNTAVKSLWGKRGRKTDPAGTRADGVKVIDMNATRLELERALTRV